VTRQLEPGDLIILEVAVEALAECIQAYGGQMAPERLERRRDQLDVAQNLLNDMRKDDDGP